MTIARLLRFILIVAALAWTIFIFSTRDWSLWQPVHEYLAMIWVGGIATIIFVMVLVRRMDKDGYL